MTTTHRVVRRSWWPNSMVLWWWVPVVWRWLPWFREPTVILKREYSYPHELGHVEWMWERSPWFPRLRFYPPYLLSRTFRMRAEAYAIAREIAALLEEGKGHTYEQLLPIYGARLAAGWNLGSKFSPKECAEQIDFYFQKRGGVV